MVNFISALGLSFLITIVLGPALIKVLYRLKFGQQIREVGPQSHLAKKGTPTMGGVMMILAITIATLVVIKLTDQILWGLFLTLGFGLIGLFDDLIKIVLARSLGLRAWQKIVGQLVLSGLLAFYVVNNPDLTNILVPFTNQTFNFGILTVPFIMFVVIGTVNGVNLTDGLDGLAAGVTLVVSLTFAFLLALQGNYEMAAFALTVAGTCLGFSWFNSHPAQVFMGDTGSFTLGGAIAALAIFGKMEIFLVLIGGIYVIEVVADILQVTYFKISGGKRIFKMAPIHHHFELSGWKEPQVVTRFVIVSILFSMLSILGYVHFIK